jgi:6-pyruvoyltetrahydropterin/6-carboxytetrahydropterin synthase
VSRWIIHAEASFDARHALTSYRGKREPVHGHQWKVVVRVGADAVNEEGYALDFHEVQSILDAMVEPLDGTELNQHSEIGNPSPTAERVAEVLAEKLGPEYLKIGGRLLSVSVWEGPENRVDLILSDDN